MRIFVVSTMRCAREALRTALLDMKFQGQVDELSIAALRSASFTLPPHLVLVASSSPDSIECLAGFRASHPSTKVAVLAIEDRDEDFFAWARFGICGYIEADTSLAKIGALVLRIAAGEVIYPKRLSGALLNRFAQHSVRKDAQNGLDMLTRREISVLELLADGLSNKQIAGCLSISDATVKNHVHSLLEKMAVHSRGEAAASYRRSAAQGRVRVPGPARLPAAPGNHTPLANLPSGDGA